jgi:hypothetical protein
VVRNGQSLDNIFTHSAKKDGALAFISYIAENIIFLLYTSVFKHGCALIIVIASANSQRS